MKKLVLHKETLRTLQDSELRLVVGGWGNGEIENLPLDDLKVIIMSQGQENTCSCPTDFVPHEAHGLHLG